VNSAYDVVLAGFHAVSVEFGFARSCSGLQRRADAEVQVAVLEEDVHRAFESAMCQRVVRSQHLLHVHQTVTLRATTTDVLGSSSNST